MNETLFLVLIALYEFIGFAIGLSISLIINKKLKEELKLEREINYLKQQKINELKIKNKSN